MKIGNNDIEKAYEALKMTADEFNALSPLSIDTFDPEKTMLVIVDIVNGFVREGAMHSERVEDIIPPVVSLMKKCSERKIAMTAFADCHEADCGEFLSFPPHCIRGTSESEIVDEIKAQGGYIQIDKNSTNGFHEKAFTRLLADNPGIDTFIVTGDCTDICVMQLCLSMKTYFNAADKPCRIIIPTDCVETYDAPCHNGAFMNIAAYKLMKDSGIEFAAAIE